jgi:hypothetical protein
MAETAEMPETAERGPQTPPLTFSAPHPPGRRGGAPRPLAHPPQGLLRGAAAAAAPQPQAAANRAPEPEDFTDATSPTRPPHARPPLGPGRHARAERRLLTVLLICLGFRLGAPAWMTLSATEAVFSWLALGGGGALLAIGAYLRRGRRQPGPRAAQPPLPAPPA